MARKSREEAKAETRAALLLAALELFSEEGLDGPSLDRICARAGYTRGAFYVHFQSRDDLQFAVMERVLKAWTRVIVHTADEDGGDLARTIQTFVSTFTTSLLDPDADPFLRLGTANIHLMLGAARRDPALGQRLSALLQQESARLAGVVSSAQGNGSVRADVGPEAAADLLVTVVLGVLSMAPVGFPPDVLRLHGAVQALLAPQ